MNNRTITSRRARGWIQLFIVVMVIPLVGCNGAGRMGSLLGGASSLIPGGNPVGAIGNIASGVLKGNTSASLVPPGPGGTTATPPGPGAGAVTTPGGYTLKPDEKLVTGASGNPVVTSKVPQPYYP